MKNNLSQQSLPIILTLITFLGLTGLLVLSVQILNLFPTHTKIIPLFHFADIVVGTTIYLKTSVDFALFIGNIMKTYTSIKNRIAIEIGTALGNGIGTLLVLTIWTFFKEIPLLLVIMILLATCVLFVMAEESLRELLEEHSRFKIKPILFLYSILDKINLLFRPITHLILPKSSGKSKVYKTFSSLLLFSFSIPFILGLDDFAGYIPLFNIVNVVGFATGVFLGHMLLNIFLFASPRTTIAVIKQPLVSFLGSLAFITIGCIGLFEAYKVFLH